MPVRSIKDLSEDCLREFVDFMTGDCIGEGMSRTVYEHPYDPELVIKVENSTRHFQNVLEWEIWRTFEHCPKVARWLAPCHSISHSGTFLIQAKARDLTQDEKPKQLPTWIQDHKLTNFGMIKNKVVCRDYGLLTLDPNMRLRNWRGE